MTVQDFLAWEKASRDTIDVKRCYIDICGDLVGGILLSQIVFWHLPDAEGRSKLKVRLNGRLWLVKRRDDWWEECRISARQYDRSIRMLSEKNLVTTEVHKSSIYWGDTVTHIALNWDVFFGALKAVITGKYSCDVGFTERVNPESRHSKSGLPKKDTPYKVSETTPKTIYISSSTPPAEEEDKNGNSEVNPVTLPAPFFSADKQSQLRLINTCNDAKIDPVELCQSVAWEYAQAGKQMRDPMGAAISKVLKGGAQVTIYAYRQTQAVIAARRQAESANAAVGKEAEERKAVEARELDKCFANLHEEEQEQIKALAAQRVYPTLRDNQLAVRVEIHKALRERRPIIKVAEYKADL